MSKQFNLIESLSNALQIRRTSQFIGYLGVTHRLNRSTALMKRLIVNRYHLVPSVGSPMEGRDEATSMRVIKRIETVTVGSQSNALDAFSVRLIITVITLAINDVD